MKATISRDKIQDGRSIVKVDDVVIGFAKRTVGTLGNSYWWTFEVESQFIKANERKSFTLNDAHEVRIKAVSVFKSSLKKPVLN